MSQYKLIKSYPGSPTLGTIATEESPYYRYNGCCMVFMHIIEGSPEYWELVVEKDYEILKVVAKWSSPSYSPGDIINYSKLIDYSAIYSVKRLSDGEIFTINDKLDGFDVTAKISLFRIENNQMKVGVRECGIVGLSTCKHKLKPIFTTEDGYDVFEKELLYTVGFTYKVDGADYYKIATTNMKYTNKPNDIDYKWFKSKEKAEVWIEENKLQYSKLDMIAFTSSLCLGNAEKYVADKLSEWNNIKK